MTKDQKTIKTQATEIERLTNEVTRLKSDLETTSKYKQQYDAELQDVHSTFDLLGVPRSSKNNYHSLTANARLTLFLAQAHGIKVEQPKDGD